MTAAERIGRFKLLTEQVLPALAAKNGWPLRLDHCFKRVCLDWAFRDVWYRHLARPAERHLAGEALLRAVACAELLARDPKGDVLRERNTQSLVWRGKASIRMHPQLSPGGKARFGNGR